MKRRVLIVAVASCTFAAVVGCRTSDVAQVGPEPRAEISYAATAKYPGAARESDEVKLTAVTDPENDDLTIFNVTDNAIGPATIWVNGAFVHRVSGIAPRASVKIKHAELLQAGAGTADLKRLEQPVRKVEIQTKDGLFTVQGPSQKPA